MFCTLYVCSRNKMWVCMAADANQQGCHTFATSCTYRILEDDADVDDDVARLLEGTGGDPDIIRGKASGLLPGQRGLTL